MINSTDINYFIETANTKNISRAAERLGVSQPALSISLKRIENSVGLKLFIRTKKGVSLTETGQRFYNQCHVLVEQWSNLVKSVHDDAEKVSGQIKLGCHTAVAQYTLPKFLPKLVHDYPLLKIKLVHDLSRHLTEDVISARLDVAIVVNPVPHPDLVIKELCKDIVAVWKPKNCINPKLLMYEPHLLQTQDILRKLNRKEKHFDQTLESSSLEVLSQLLAVGTGCAILPKRVVEVISHQEFEIVKDSPVFHDRICLIYKPIFKKSKKGQVVLNSIVI